MLRSPFFWRVYRSYMVLIFLTIAAVGLVTAIWVRSETILETERYLEMQVKLISELTVPDITVWQTDEFRGKIRRLGVDTGARYTIILVDGTVIADSMEDPSEMEIHSMRPEIVDARRYGEGISMRRSNSLGIDMMYVARPLHGSDNRIDGYVRVSVEMMSVRRRLVYLGSTIASVAAIVGLAALLIGFVVAGKLTGDIRQLNTSVKAVASGDYARRVRVGGRDEIAQLAESVNLMANQLSERLDAIIRERNQLLAVLSGMVEGVIAIDSKDNVLHANKTASGILGIDATSGIGRKIWEVTRVRAIADLVEDVKKTHRSVSRSVTITSDSKQMELEAFASSMSDTSGRPAGAVIVLHDVTELRSLEKIRRDFVANAAHELQTPLTAIRGIVETVFDDDSMPRAQRRKFLDKIRTQTLRLSAILDDLLMLSKAEAAGAAIQAPLLDMREPVDDATEAFAADIKAKRIEFELEMVDKPITIEARHEEVRRIVDNLLSNAIKYTPEGGKVRVTVTSDEEHATLQIIDTGIGIEAKDLDRIFERFYRVDKARSREMGGTGLGLSIVKHLVTYLRGEVKVQSRPGRGSTFSVILPLARNTDEI